MENEICDGPAGAQVKPSRSLFLHKIVSYLRYSVPKSHITQLTHEELLT